MLLALLTLSGCFSNYWWKDLDEMNTLDPSEVPYSVPGLEATDAVVTSFDAAQTCPDGEPATFFVVYREGVTSDAPVAVVFHSGAFDYVIDPDDDQPLSGDHYYLDSRLTRTWSISKIWETLGMLYPRTIDASEQNLGALPAALTDAGVVSIYPGNCWGDLWHDDAGVADNDPSEGFTRSGRTLALDMVDMLFNAQTASDLGFDIPVTLDTNQLYLIGLGSGGRAVTELMLSDTLPPLEGALIDSSPDDLSAYVDGGQAFADEIVGLGRIFADTDPSALSDWSTAAVTSGELATNTAYIWSSADPDLPVGAALTGAEALSDDAWVYDTGARAHVASNADIDFAGGVVDFLMTGQEPSLGD